MTIIATHSRQSVFILDEVTGSLGLFKQKPPHDFKLWVSHTIIPTCWQSSLTAFSKRVFCKNCNFFLTALKRVHGVLWV